MLFIDGRKLGTLIPGSRKQKQLAAEDVQKIASVYREFKRNARPSQQPGFANVVNIDELRTHEYALAAGRYVGAAETDDEGESIEVRLPKLVESLRATFDDGLKLTSEIRRQLDRLSHEGF